MNPELDELVEEFTAQGIQLLDDVLGALATLGQDLENPAPMTMAFRAMHTIAGTGELLGLTGISEQATCCEAGLQLLRDSPAPADAGTVAGLTAEVLTLKVELQRLATDQETNLGQPGDALEPGDQEPGDQEPGDQEPGDQEPGDPETLEEFIIGSNEILDALDRSFVVLESDPSDEEQLGAAFRAMHTIKGDSGLLGLANLERLAHQSESMLDLLRDEVFLLDTEVTDTLLATVDLIRDCLTAIAETGSDGSVTTDHVIEDLQRLAAERTAGDRPTDPRNRVGDILVDRADAERVDVEIAAAEQQFGDSRQIGEILADQGTASENAVADALASQRTAPPASERTPADATIRVDVTVLDDLMNLVGELVLTRNEILRHAVTNPDAAFGKSSQQLDLITSNLQDKVMKTRMQAISVVWAKLPRVVRDLSNQCGKQLRLELHGEETELDKSLLEAIRDPLTHIVRNTIDHGIEPPDQRVAAGKPSEGVLRLVASHEGGHVTIRVEDDGRGIDLGRVRAKAIEKGMIDQASAAAMSDGEAIELIFQPGFSTTTEITKISGRGVGMDVVRNNIESAGGSVEVATEAGIGTIFTLRIPLTLAIVPALIVDVGGASLAIPQTGLEELLTLGDSRAIEFINGTPVLRIRGRLLPIVDLRNVLDPLCPERWKGDVVIVTVDGRTFGIVVDEVLETQEIVVKPLGSITSHVGLFSGATILGDGKVALIIDLLGIAADTGVVGGPEATLEVGGQEEASSDPEAAEHATLILLKVGAQQLAMTLAQVARLEEFHESQIEYTRHNPVIQYRGQVMPLIDLGQEFGHRTVSRDDNLVSVVVHVHQGRDIGLLVEEVLDIVEAPPSELLGSPVLRGRVTELIEPALLSSVRRLTANAGQDVGG